MSEPHVCPHESQACDPATRLCGLCLHDRDIEDGRRERVIETARALLPQFVRLAGEGSEDAEAIKSVILIAQAFEIAAAKYRETGKC